MSSRNRLARRRAVINVFILIADCHSGEVTAISKGQRLAAAVLAFFGVILPIIGAIALAMGHWSKALVQIALGVILLAYSIPRLRS